jgi:hypothetical protein
MLQTISHRMPAAHPQAPFVKGSDNLTIGCDDTDWLGFSAAMARPIRVEYARAVYHNMAQGNRGQKIRADDVDRTMWLATASDACRRTGWRIHARVLMLMGNHYHLLLGLSRWVLGAGQADMVGQTPGIVWRSSPAVARPSGSVKLRLEGGGANSNTYDRSL